VPLGSTNWRRALISEESTLEDAIRCLNDSGFRIALVVKPGDFLEGTLTDGDIRRGLLRGMRLQDSVAPVVRRNPLVVPVALGLSSVLQLMKTNQLHQVPMVDESRRVIGLHLLDTLIAPQSRDNPVVLMAGGRGTRLRPHTETCPKPMLPLAGKPMLEHILDRAIAEGFSRFVLAVHYLGHMVEAHFGDGSRWGIQIDYLWEEVPLGTAGALSLMPVPDQSFIVANGDVLTDIKYGDLLDFHLRHDAEATMAVRLHEWENPFGVVHLQGFDIVGFEEKPVMRSHINAGVYALTPSALNLLVRNESCDMPTLFERLQHASARTIAYPMHEQWLDVGRDHDLHRARAGVLESGGGS